MKTIQRVLLMVVTMTTICALSAQNFGDFKGRLATPSELGARVTVSEDANAKAALTKISESSQKSGFLGYRIGIFFDNSPTARARADAAKELFEEKFPDESVYMVYENPYFKVSAGNCVTQEEAVMLLDRIQKHFPKAYLMREQLAIDDIIIKEKIIAEPYDSLMIEASRSEAEVVGSEAVLP